MLIVDVDVDCKLLWFILSCLPPQQQHLASADNKLLQDLSYRPVPGQKKLKSLNKIPDVNKKSLSVNFVLI